MVGLRWSAENAFMVMGALFLADSFIYWFNGAGEAVCRYLKGRSSKIACIGL
jgi:hypothetical protein